MSVSVAIDLFYATLPITKLAVLVAFLAFILPDFSVGGALRSHIRPTLPLGLIFILAWFWLCFVSIHVPKPYLVCSSPSHVSELLLISFYRMRSSTSRRPRSIAKEDGLSGTTRSPLPRACESPSSTHSVLLPYLHALGMAYPF